MPGYVFQVGAKLLCPHGGQVTLVPSAPRAKSNGMPLTTIGDTATVAGCTNLPTPALPSNKPCTTVKWLMGAARVKIAGQPALVPTALGVWDSVPPVPSAPATVVLTQTRVKAL